MARPHHEMSRSPDPPVGYAPGVFFYRCKSSVVKPAFPQLFSEAAGLPDLGPCHILLDREETVPCMKRHPSYQQHHDDLQDDRQCKIRKAEGSGSVPCGSVRPRRAGSRGLTWSMACTRDSTFLVLLSHGTADEEVCLSNSQPFL